jgi:hypothetical protein
MAIYYQYQVKVDETNKVVGTTTAMSNEPIPLDSDCYEVMEDPSEKLGYIYDPQTGEFSLTAEDARRQRNNLLAQTDWRASSDLTLDSDWAVYRQSLRDVPAQAGFPGNVVWPTKPT